MRARRAVIVVAALAALVLALPAVSPAADGWNPPQTVDPAFRTTAVACPTADFCIAVSDGGAAATFDGSAWSPPQPVDPGRRLAGVSCPSAAFCLTVNDGGDAFVLQQGTWTPGPSAAAPVRLLSCASASSCVAIGPGDGGTASSYTFDGQSWSGAVPVPLAGVQGLACPAATECLATDDSGQASRFDGSSWSTATQVSDGTSADGAVSCASPAFCLAVNDTGHAARYNGLAWTAAPDIPASAAHSVSCSGPTRCVAAGTTVAVFNGTAWAAGPSIDSEQTFTVACARATQTCAAASSSGRGAILDGDSVSQSAILGGGLASISCPSATSCTAVDVNGRAVSFDGIGWSNPAAIDSSDLVAVSCPTTAVCFAADRSGGVLASRDGTWGSVTHVDDAPLSGLSCSGPTSCVAIDDAGRSVAFDGTAWGAPVALAFLPAAVSCASSSFCAAAGGAEASIYDGTSWAAPSELAGVSPSMGAVGMACPAEGTCTVATRAGFATFNGQGWTSVALVEPTGAPLDAVACASAATCEVTDDGGGASLLFGGAWTHTAGVGVASQGSGSLSCGSVAFCVLAEPDGQVVSYTPAEPVNSVAPVVSGSLIRGQTLEASTGTWSGTGPLDYQYQWQRCTPGCHDVLGAARPTYREGPSDVGLRLRVEVTAADVAGSDVSSSVQTGRVQPALAQVRSGLAAALRVRGAGGRIGRLVHNRAYVVRLPAAGPGRVRIAWRASRHNTTVASANVAVKRAGVTRIRITLTAAGRRLLTRDRRATLHVQASFTPTGGPAVTRRGTLHLRR